MKKETFYLYPRNVIRDIQDYFEFNERVELTESDVMAMEPTLVLELYLNWNGIFGYTHDIIEIMKARKERN